MKTLFICFSLVLPLSAQDRQVKDTPFVELLDQYLEYCRRDSVRVPVLVSPISSMKAETLWSSQGSQFTLKFSGKPVWEADQPPVYRLYWRPREATLWDFRGWLKSKGKSN